MDDLQGIWEPYQRMLKQTKIRDKFAQWGGDECLADLASMTESDVFYGFSGGDGHLGGHDKVAQFEALIAEYPRYANIQHLAQCAIDGNWDEFQEGVFLIPKLIPDALNIFYPFMPDEYRREFVLRTYRNGGDELQSCREAVKSLPREGANELPDDLRGQDVITVYRAGLEDIDEAPRRLSWTTSLEVASFFYVRHDGGNVYRACIRPSDVIAYSDAREEKEVLQFDGVYDVEKVEPDVKEGRALGARFDAEEVERLAKEMRANAKRT